MTEVNDLIFNFPYYYNRGYSHTIAILWPLPHFVKIDSPPGKGEGGGGGTKRNLR